MAMKSPGERGFGAVLAASAGESSARALPIAPTTPRQWGTEKPLPRRLVSSRTLFAALLALVCSCGTPGRDPVIERPPFAVTMTGPTAPFRGPADVTATPEPADGVVEVRFEVDGAERARDTTAPYAASLDFSHDWGGAHHIKALAFRDDGSKAEASIDVSYDPLGPFVTVLKPATGLRVSPTGGMVDVAFAASDPNGLAAGSVQIAGGAPTAVPLSSLALTVEVPKALDPPANTELSWWFEDTLGNRTQGAINLLQSSVQLSATFDRMGQVFPLPGRRMAVLLPSRLHAIEADGSPVWTLDGSPSQFAGGVSAVGGDLLVEWFPPGGGVVVQRVHPDGSVAWTWSSDPSFATVRALYVAESDSLLVLRRKSAEDGLTALLLGPTASETPVKTYTSDVDVWPFATPPGASPGGFALCSASGAAMAQCDVFDGAGAAVWSFTLGSFDASTALLTRDALYGPVEVADPLHFAIVGPGGIVADLGDVDRSLVAANGDVVIGTHTPTDSAVTRLHPDGGTVWQVPLSAPVTDLSGGSDRVGVTTGTSLRVVDATGGVVEWMSDADPWKLVSPRMVPAPSGAFYAIGDLASGNKRVYRAAADGTTLWHETLFELGTLGAVLLAPDDERLVVSVQDKVMTRIHVLGP
ncbi:Hypothetical protein A7982_00267 [Minicystis rosea]|nr:Hypothetical protein A7982_00267 [Minicystis rosea]